MLMAFLASLGRSMIDYLSSDDRDYCSIECLIHYLANLCKAIDRRGTIVEAYLLKCCL